MRALFWLVIIIGGLAWFGSSAGRSTPRPQPSQPTATPTSAYKAPPVAPAEPGSQWRIQSGTSAIDDSKSVYLQVSSENDISGWMGGPGPATLLIRCLENTTTVMFKFNDHFMSDIGSYGQLVYRIDDRQAATKSMKESTDHEWLGLWSGGSAIPFAKGMFGGKSMVVRATPYNESAIEATFKIEGIEEKIAPLREACGW